ncbi:asparaginase [Williamsia phyllosphaerae]|uniref:asparaginase n=1 Tax=Williamsia phyllosphaerae TaxID=885042 RepID=A0ABQ1V0I3_9NOCA|nr:asparaginase [Williamsia phyllosphaerae]GGF29638.1 L-asparaginase [Williamsia phyllosphaerae]
MPGPPRIVVLSTGGTIAAQRRPGGAVPVLHAADLLTPDLVPPHLTDVTISTRTVCAVDSAAMTDAEHRLLLRAIDEELTDPNVVGVVVTHGTDTLEETALVVDLVHADPRPVVFAGAQYSADSPRADGPTNLAAALACAADGSNRDRGVLIAFGGRVLPARGVAKTSTTATDAFDSVVDTPERPVLARVDAARPTARVDIVTLHPDFDATVVGALLDAGARGVVLAALGSGNAHPTLTDAVEAATARGAVVVLSTRVPFGVVVPTYGGGGGAVDLIAAGAILSPWLRAPQARIVLCALLTRDFDRARIADFLAGGSSVS